MLLEPEDAEQFFRLNRTLLHFVNQRLELLDDVNDPEEFSHCSPEERLIVRDALLDHMDLIAEFVAENPAQLPDDELEIVHSWRHLVTGEFFILRQLRQYAVFLSANDPAVAYGVLAVTEPFEDMVSVPMPCMVKAVLLSFKGQIAYDGLMVGYNVSFGPGYRRDLKESYAEAKERQGIVFSLPAPDAPPESASPSRIAKWQPVRRQTKRRTSQGRSEDVQSVLQTVIGIIDEFCRDHLNDEYAAVCRKMAERLARKRPSPLLSGKPHTWACGIVRTVGWVNFLDSSSRTPHMKLTDIDEAFGVAQSTAYAKSKAVRTALRIHPLDPDWTIASLMEGNPLIWMLKVNGVLMDIRDAPRRQEEAFAQGLIPYIPADQPDDDMED